MPLSEPLISTHHLLSASECERVVERLGRHSQLACDRNPRLPGTFVTYGRAAYLDVCLARADEEADYYGRLADSNHGLSELLGDILEQLRNAVELLAGEEVIYRPDILALPGIHIFRGLGIRSAADAGSHFDVQYQRLRLPSLPDPDARPISLTMLLRGPKNGTGLRVHDITYEDYERAYRSGRITNLEELIARKSHAYWPYEPGEIVLHHGLVVHCICSPGPILPTDERITLQAHGIRCNGRWILYW